MSVHEKRTVRWVRSKFGILASFLLPIIAHSFLPLFLLTQLFVVRYLKINSFSHWKLLINMTLLNLKADLPNFFVETNKIGFLEQEELDIRTLQTKNRKLAEMLDQRQAIEDELREHIEKLERRQATDDASLLIVNRYWSQVAHLFVCSDF